MLSCPPQHLLYPKVASSYVHSPYSSVNAQLVIRLYRSRTTSLVAAQFHCRCFWCFVASNLQDLLCFQLGKTSDCCLFKKYLLSICMLGSALYLA